jgi:hypothetical protein
MSKWGMIDDSVIQRKYELTKNTFVDKNDIGEYNRNLLADWGPDPISLESDRTTRNKFSGTKLNLYHTGIRQSNVPNHPDLCLALTDPDPRGASNEPDNEKFRQQSWRRKNDHKFKPDADNSISSGGFHAPETIQRMKTELFKKSKSRFNEFDTSTDGRISSYNVTVPIKSDFEKVEVVDKWTNELKDLNEETNANRRDYTTSLSNILPVGYNGVTDNKFAIAQYGQKYKLLNPNDNNFEKNRAETTADQKTTETKSGFASSPMELLVSQIQSRKKNSTNPQDTKYKDSAFTAKYSTNTNVVHDNTLEKLFTEQSHPLYKLIDEVTKNYNRQFNKNGKLNMNQVDAIMDQIKSKNSDMLANMYSSKGKDKIENILRNIILSHNKKSLINNDVITKTYTVPKQEVLPIEKDKFIVDFNSIQRNNPDCGTNKMYTRKLPERCDLIEADKVGFNYDILNMFGTDNITQYRMNPDKINDPKDMHKMMSLDNEFRDTQYMNRRTGVHGKKYMHGYSDTARNLNDIDDVTSMRMR